MPTGWWRLSSDQLLTDPQPPTPRQAAAPHAAPQLTDSPIPRAKPSRRKGKALAPLPHLDMATANPFALLDPSGAGPSTAPGPSTKGQRPNSHRI